VFGFKILEKELKPTSAYGNHPVAIIRTTETYENLAKTSLKRHHH